MGAMGALMSASRVHLWRPKSALRWTRALEDPRRRGPPPSGTAAPYVANDGLGGGGHAGTVERTMVTGLWRE